MNEDERYQFDLQGFVVVPNALSAETVATLNAELDSQITAHQIAPDALTHRFPFVVDWSPAYRKVINNPILQPYLTELLGENYRLDHDYLDILRQGNGMTKAWLHGGGTPFDPSQYYRWDNGKMRNGLTVVAYNLHDVNPGDGGFACVPGSHKSNLPYPQKWRYTFSEPPWMIGVTGAAGTAIVFTEALTHGTLPWVASHERRTLFFKFSPYPISWSAHYYNSADYPEMTEEETAVLEAPNARYKTRHRPRDIG